MLQSCVCTMEGQGHFGARRFVPAVERGEGSRYPMIMWKLLSGVDKIPTILVK